MLEDSGFTNVTIGPPVDNFGGTAGEEQARAFDVYGYTFLAFKRRANVARRGQERNGRQIAAAARLPDQRPRAAAPGEVVARTEARASRAHAI